MPDKQPKSLRKAREIGRRDILFSVARVPNTERLLLASSAGKVIELDVSQDKAKDQELADHGRYVTSVRLSGNRVISGGYDARLIWSDLEAKRTIRTIDDAHGRWIRHIEISPNGRVVASVADDMVCRLWDVASGKRIRELRGHAERTPTHFTSMLYTCAFSPDGKHLATGDRIGHVIIWDVDRGEEIGSVDAPELYTWDGRQRIRSIGGVRSLAFSPDGKQLAVGGVGKIGNVDSIAGKSRGEVFDWANQKRLGLFEGEQGMINRLEYHPSNSWLFGAGGRVNGVALFYDPKKQKKFLDAKIPMHVHDAVFDEDFAKLYCVGHKKIYIAELKN